MAIGTYMTTLRHLMLRTGVLRCAGLSLRVIGDGSGARAATARMALRGRRDAGMSWSSRRGRWPWHWLSADRPRRGTAGATALLALAGFLTTAAALPPAPPAHAAAAPAVPQPPAVHGTNGMHYAVPKLKPTVSAPPGPRSWPSARSATASMATTLPAQASARTPATGRV